MDSSWCAALLIIINVAIWCVLCILPRFRYKKTIFMLLSFISLWIFLIIREPFSDAISYERFFESLKIGDFDTVLKTRWEILFKVLLYAIKFFTSNAQMMFGIVSFITLIGPFLFIRRYSKFPLLSVVMFIAIGSFYAELYILRQAIAISIFLTFFYLIHEKKFFKYCLAIIVAALFHKTALVLLLLYPLTNIPSSKIKKLFLIAMTMFSLILLPIVSNFLLTGPYKYFADQVVVGGGVKLLIFYFVLCGVYLLLKQTTRAKEKPEIVYGALFTTIMQLFTVENNIFSRITLYTRDSFCILIPNIIQEMNPKHKALLSLAIIVMCICFVFITDPFAGYSVL